MVLPELQDVSLCLTNWSVTASSCEGITPNMMSPVGIVLTLISQGLRSGAMIHAATNFSHAVMVQKEDSHKLVTTGIYRYAVC